MCPEPLAVLEPSLVVDSPLVPTLSSPPAGGGGGGWGAARFGEREGGSCAATGCQPQRMVTNKVGH